MTMAILNEGLEFGLWLSAHILGGTIHVLAQELGWSRDETSRYETFLRAAADRTGGLVEPQIRVANCSDWEDNRILELAEACGAMILVSSDDHLLSMSPWRGIPIMDPATFVTRVDAMRRRRPR